MPAIHLSLDIPCTPEEAAWFAAVLVFLDDFARDPAALPGPELDGLFGEHPRETLLGIIGHPAPLGLTSRYDRAEAMLTITDDLGAPSLAALPVLLLWLYPDKLPLAYAVRTADHPDLPVWTIVSLSRIEIIQDGDTVEARLAALRAEPRHAHRIDRLPTRPLTDTSQ